MRKMKEGESLAERIEIYMEKAKKKGVTQPIDDCFYEEHVEKGMPFQVRRSNFLRDVPMKKKAEKEVWDCWNLQKQPKTISWVDTSSQ